MPGQALICEHRQPQMNIASTVHFKGRCRVTATHFDLIDDGFKRQADAREPGAGSLTFSGGLSAVCLHNASRGATREGQRKGRDKTAVNGEQQTHASRRSRLGKTRSKQARAHTRKAEQKVSD